MEHDAHVIDLLGRKKTLLEEAESSFLHLKCNANTAAKNHKSKLARVRADIAREGMMHIEKTSRALSVLRGAIDVRKMTNECVGDAFPPSDDGKKKTKVNVLIKEMKHLRSVLDERQADLEKEGVKVHGHHHGHGYTGQNGSIMSRSVSRGMHQDGVEGSNASSMSVMYSKHAAALLHEASLRDPSVIHVRKQCLVTRVGITRYDVSAAHQLADLLASHAHRITTLIVQQNWLMPAGLAALAPSLETLTILTSLDLSSNDLRPQGAVLLAPVLSSLCKLRVLLLGCNHMHDDGIKALSMPLCALSELQHLDISKNKMTSDAVASLSDFISEAHNLRTLDISGNVTQYSFHSSDGPDLMSKLVGPLVKCACVETFNASSNFLFPLGAKFVSQFAMGTSNTLKHLNIGGTR
jgi:hypothetical protein